MSKYIVDDFGAGIFFWIFKSSFSVFDLPKWSICFLSLFSFCRLLIRHMAGDASYSLDDCSSRLYSEVLSLHEIFTCNHVFGHPSAKFCRIFSTTLVIVHEGCKDQCHYCCFKHEFFYYGCDITCWPFLFLDSFISFFLFWNVGRQMDNAEIHFSDIGVYLTCNLSNSLIGTNFSLLICRLVMVIMTTSSPKILTALRQPVVVEGSTILFLMNR